MVKLWNSDKPHRCPDCHVIVDTGKPANKWALYQCCHCRVFFARHPRLVFFRRARVCQDIAIGECPYSPKPGH